MQLGVNTPGFFFLIVEPLGTKEEWEGKNARTEKYTHMRVHTHTHTHTAVITLRKDEKRCKMHF